MNDDRLTEPDAERPTPQGRSLTEIEVQELLPAYALGALEPEEMLAVADFLELHPTWQARLESLEGVASSLAHAAPRAPLPARVKEELLRQARADAPPVQPASTQRPAQRRRAVPFGAPPPARQPQPAPRGMRPIRPPQPRPAPAGPGWFGIFWRSVVTAGALAAILLLAGITWQLRSQVAQLTAQVSTLQGQLAQLEGQNEELRQVNTTLQAQLDREALQVRVLTNPEQAIPLSPVPDGPNASGAFFRRGTDAVLVLQGLTPLPSDQTYQLWLLPPDGDDSIPADLLEVTTPEWQTLAVVIDPQYSNLVGVGISVEPAGGSAQPTDIVLLGSAPAPRA
jgi:anti-sigma-K factor RskA